MNLSLEELTDAGLFAGANGSTRAFESGSELDALHRAQAWPRFLRAAVGSRCNILVTGATGSGKTTLAKSLVQLIPLHDRIVTIEDTRELVLPHRNAVHLLYAKDGQGLAQVSAKSLMESALRMRPDRILLQELRDASAFFYLRTANTGHPGSITTLHADSAALAFEQLILMVKESEAGQSLMRSDICAMLEALVDVVVHVRREAGRFRVTEILYGPSRARVLAA